MLEQRGDLWTIDADARCVTTNSEIKRDGRLVMGAGVAKQAIKRYPDLDARIASLIKVFGNLPFYFADLGIISFPTKNDWRDPSDIDLIRNSAEHAKWIADAHGLKRIVLTRPGCGCGGLYWPHVREVIAPILDNRFTVITPEISDARPEVDYTAHSGSARLPAGFPVHVEWREED